MNRRTIKFRVWNGATKEWVHGPGHECNLFGESILLGGFCPVSLDQLNECIPLQYTEQNDKAGREIYDGDIVRVGGISLRPKCARVFWSPHGVWQMEYIGWIVAGVPVIGWISTDIEVIGNIYDNPTLTERSGSTSI